MELLFLCLKIFFIRIIDVSMGTVATILTVKGKKILASVIGFIEILLWFLIVKEALNTDETSILIAISYALGFATGTYFGGYISEKFISGNFGVQVITSNKKLINILRKEGFGLTAIDILSEDEVEKYMLFIEIDKTKFINLRKIIKKYDKNAFVVVNETKEVYNGYFQK